MELLYLIAGIGIGFGYGFLLFREKPEEKKDDNLRAEGFGEESLHRAYRNGPPCSPQTADPSVLCEDISPNRGVSFDKGGIPDPMSLRNGFGVTKAKDPTFAEQWVNVLNYDGRNQKEEDYGGEEDYSAENMG